MFLRELFKIFRTAVFQDIFRHFQRKTTPDLCLTTDKQWGPQKLQSQVMSENIENTKFLFCILPYLN